METQQESQALVHCRHLIEKKVNWGSGEFWTTQDFEQLSALIAEQTGIALSITTLKRLWGRVKYESAPTTTTLNVLAQYLGYENWQKFKNSGYQPIAETTVVQSPEAINKSRKAVSRRRWIRGSILLGLAVVCFLMLKFIPRKSLSPELFTFSSTLTSTGIPNSVVFHYDATASPTDSVFIQQSWDPRRRQAVARDGHEVTSIYYHPGYFRAKLIVGDQIVQEHNLLIPSENWHVAIMKEPVPVYVDAEEITLNGVLGLPVKTIQQLNVPMQPETPSIRYRYVKDFKSIRSDNFTFETRLKNDFRLGSAACQQTGITILCKNEFFSIPLANKGCVGNLSLWIAGHGASASTADLSKFGVDLSKWVDLRCEVRNRMATIFIDGKQVYKARIPSAPKDIVGVSYDFEGTGSVDFVRFSKPNKAVVFEDNFE